MTRRNKRILACLMAVGLVAALSPSPASSTPKGLPEWLTKASPAVSEAILDNGSKTPPEFLDRLRYAGEDGLLGVMGRLVERTPAAESLVARATRALHWYGDSSAFYARVDQEQLAHLLSSDLTLFVEPDYPITGFLSTAAVDISARSGPGATGLWSFSPYGHLGSLRSEVPGMAANRVTGKGVVVANTDSGIDGTHRDFGGWNCEPGPMQPCDSRIIRQVTINSLVAGDDDEVRSPTSDFASGHGTHTAGIIAGNGFYARGGDNSVQSYGGDGYTFGIAPQASLISVKIGDTQSAALGLAGLQWQITHARKYDIRVSNNSWGCRDGCSFDHRSASALILENLYKEDVLITFAAGNDGGGPDGAAYNGNAQSPYVLGVAAYDDEQQAPTIASFSSRGVEGTPLPDPSSWHPRDERDGYRRPDLSAPGVRIYSAANLTGGTSSFIPRTSPHDVNTGPGIFAYTFMSGTSMSTPMVSGAAALLIGACPSASTLDVMRALMEGAQARPVVDTDGSRIAPAHVTGYGGLNVRGSLESLQRKGLCEGSDSGSMIKPFIEAPDDAVARRSITLDASRSSSENGNLSYVWGLGDGKKASGPKVSHTYRKPGYYEITLTVANDRGDSAARRKLIAVSPKPSFVERGQVQGGSYLATTSEFIFGCPRTPASQGVDGYLFRLPQPIAADGQVATISATAGNGVPVELFTSVFADTCRSIAIAYSEGSHRLTTELPPGAAFVVASIDAPRARSITVELKVHRRLPKQRR